MAFQKEMMPKPMSVLGLQWDLVILFPDLLMAALGLCCRVKALFSCSKQGLVSRCCPWASPCKRFSFC